jgi:hypothetical protein
MGSPRHQDDFTSTPGQLPADSAADRAGSDDYVPH